MEKFIDYFYKLCSIPHGSGNEEEIADYVIGVCREKGFEAEKDEFNNVIAYIPGSPGRENENPVLLDSHLDMVCVEDDGKGRDFTKTPIEVYRDGDFLTAKGTSLGGDDGAGVAMMLCLLDEDFSHPPLELLFTTSEETGMYGAIGFDYGKVKSKTVINLDSENEDEVVVGCAGGENVLLSFEDEGMPNPFKTIKITVKGLAGGHSGIEIDLGRQNANRIIGELLSNLYDKMPFALVSVDGGDKVNVITTESTAVIAVEDREAAKKILQKSASSIYKNLIRDDAQMKIYFDDKGEAGRSFQYKTTSSVISALTIPVYGVIERYEDGAPLTSQNCGIVKTEGNTIYINYHVRSSQGGRIDNIDVHYRRLAKLINANLEISERYPGFDCSRDNLVSAKYKEIYKELYGADLKESRIHAGVECGIISEGVGGGTLISIGPDIHDIHSPAERLSLSSCERVYNTLISLIEKAIPK